MCGPPTHPLNRWAVKAQGVLGTHPKPWQTLGRCGGGVHSSSHRDCSWGCRWARVEALGFVGSPWLQGL
jgi:hypothetical protein